MPIRKNNGIHLAGRIALVLACFAASSALAEHGRNFAGTFRIVHAEKGVAIAQVRLGLKILNVSGGDVRDAELTLEDRQPAGTRSAGDYAGSLHEVAIPYRASLNLEAAFEVPEGELEQWERGAVPNLIIRYYDDTGRQVTSRVELVPAR